MQFLKTTVIFSLIFFVNIVQARNKTRLHIGIELSELLQNRFRNLGTNNFTILGGAEFPGSGRKNFGCRLMLINVQLSNEHLMDNHFIKGDKSNLSGRLFVSRCYAELYPLEKKLGFVSFAPVAGFGPGYSRILFQNTDIYELKGITLGANLRLQTQLFNRIFIEFPVIDVSPYLWKNRSTHATIGSATIEYPEWGEVYFWINLGVKFRV